MFNEISLWHYGVFVVEIREGMDWWVGCQGEHGRQGSITEREERRDDQG